MVTSSRAAVVLLLLLGTACGKNDGVPIGAGASGPANKIIFLTRPNFPNGNLGGTSGADDKCASEAQALGHAGTFKAMLNSNVRRACTTAFCSGGTSENLDWVLRPNTAYYQDDGTTKIGTTNAGGVFTFPLEAPFGTSGDTTWAGFDFDWRSIAHTCNNWTVGVTGGHQASAGSSSDTGQYSISTGNSTWSCDPNMGFAIYCAQQ